MSVAAFSTYISILSLGAIFNWMYLSKAKGAHSFLVYDDPLIFGGKINEIGAFLRKMIIHFVGSTVDRAIMYSLLFIVCNAQGHFIVVLWPTQDQACIYLGLFTCGRSCWLSLSLSRYIRVTTHQVMV